MKNSTHNYDLFRVAADIEAETPITVGATAVDSEGRFLSSEFVKPDELNDWVSRFPIEDMRRLKFSLPTDTSEAEAVLRFFEVSSPEQWQSTWHVSSIALRQTQVFDARREAVAAWVREAEIIAKQIPLVDYSEETLRSSLNKLRRLTRESVEVAMDKAQQICSRFGVALVIVPELPGTRLSGCARWLDNKHALVGLTTRYKKDDQLWFTFFHELGHILLHRKSLTFVVDNAADYFGDKVVDANMEQYEEEADLFSTETLIPQNLLNEFLQFHGKTLTNDEIHNFANSIGVGPGIIIGRLQHDGFLEWHQGNALKQTIDWGFNQED